MSETAAAAAGRQQPLGSRGVRADRTLPEAAEMQSDGEACAGMVRGGNYGDLWQHIAVQGVDGACCLQWLGMCGSGRVGL